MATVAVIGAGPLGLLALKNLREDGFNATAFEQRDRLGGLWKHSDENIITVNPNTVFNSSRFRCAFSDFPFADDVSDFPTNQQMFAYLNSYADHFSLRPHIRLNSAAKDMKRKGGKWELTVLVDGKELKTEQFDKIMVATGSFHQPKMPKVPGIDQFAGDVRHSVKFSPTEQYKDQKVLIIGFHATAVDVASSLTEYASKMYLSRKNGVVLLPRYSPNGRTFDQGMNMNFAFFQMFCERWCPGLLYWMLDKLLVKISKSSFPGLDEKHHFLPAPSIETTTPVIVDQILPHFESGLCEPVGAVKRVTGPKSVELLDGTVLDDIDSIIFCTGYDFAVPFMPKEYNPYPVLGDPPALYQNIFPLHPDPEVRNSLAFMGQGASPFPGFVLLEAAGLAVGQVWKGNSKLPSLPKMQEWYENNLESRRRVKSRMKYDATYYPVFLQLDGWLRFLNDTAGLGVLEHFSWTSWQSWRFWLTDGKLYKTCLSGITSPAIFRLFDTGKRKAWPGARAQIAKDNDIADERMRIKASKDKENNKTK